MARDKIGPTGHVRRNGKTAKPVVVDDTHEQIRQLLALAAQPDDLTRGAH